MDSSGPLWIPSDAFKKNTQLRRYQVWLEKEYALHFDNYDALWQWSVDEDKMFWESLWKYFDIQYSKAYSLVRTDDVMPDTEWFCDSRLNYARHVFRSASTDYPAVLAYSESREPLSISWNELEQKTSRLAEWMRSQGIEAGDRVAAFLPNIPEATIAFLATCSIGAIWSSCSPDFGVSSVIDRFCQIKPKLLFAIDGYKYNGKSYDKQKIVREITAQLTSLQAVVEISLLGLETDKARTPWDETMNRKAGALHFEDVPFDHPIWILYSSGTTGAPKAITHSHGGVLLEHLKYLTFHNDVRPGEKFFWYTTTGWMMWNYVQASMLAGATIVLYDGSPGYPDIHALWKLTEAAGIHHFGTSAPFILACIKDGLLPGETYDLSSLRSISSTGSPLPPEAFEWVYNAVKKDVWLVSMSGGTDVCTAFIGGVPTEPVFAGEIQKRALGCALYAMDDEGNPIYNAVGEMVITQPMPSMPIYFWNDPGKVRYTSSYFEMYPGGIWRHGDWIKITDRGSVVILGRSDATLNRHGIRIGTAEIYRSLEKIDAVRDGLIINLELADGKHYMPLFIVLRENGTMDEELISRINHQLRSDYTPRHVPDEIIAVEDIPYTISGKKLEAPVKKILMGIPKEKAANLGAIRNPESLNFFISLARQINGRISK